MANLDRIVSVQIALRTAGVRQQTFSDLMLIGTHTATDRVSIITNADDLLTGFGIDDTSLLYKAAQVAFSQNPGPTRLFIGRRDALEALNDTLAACATENNDWYGFSDVTHAEADLLPGASWAEANSKLYLTTISDPDVAAATGEEPATQLMTGQFFRTAWWYHPDATAFPEVAVAARAFAVPPGGGGPGVTDGGTWANLRVAAVPAVALTETQYVNITAKNGNTFEPFRNIAMTQNGKVAAGEWIDIIRGRDWQCEEIRVNQFLNFVDKRIPYTDPGIGSIRQRLDQSLARGVRSGFLAPSELDPDTDKEVPSYTISVPSALQVPQNDKANRILRDVTFVARVAGAIHATKIRGSLTYDNIE